MKKYETHLQIICLVLGTLFFSVVGNAQTTRFSFQGELPKEITPATDTFEMQFRLLDADTGGTQIGVTNTIAAVDVKNRVFAVWLDFGGASFPGADRFIEVAVRLAGSSEPFIVIAPRSAVLSVPYAIRALTSMTADNALNLGGVDANDFVQTTDTRLSDSRDPNPGSNNYIQNTTTQQTPANFNISGSGTAGGTLSANLINSATQYNIGGSRVLSVAGIGNLFAGVGAGQANSTGAENSFYGRSAGLNNTTGFANSFFGRSAGANNTSGTENSFFGRDAGGNNTTGSDNAFFGSLAGRSNTSGFSNTFFGRLAGESNTTGANNSFFGFRTGENNTTGVFNAFFGTTAGLSNTTGLRNAFFGTNTGQANTTGSDNSFFGTNAGLLSTSGNSNSFFGSFAGQANTDGSANAFVGTAAGAANTTGGNNSYFGFLSGAASTTGDNNSFFGRFSGRSNTTGGNNSFFGVNAGFGNTEGADNAFFGIFAGDSNQTGNGNSYFGNRARGAAGIINATAIGSRAFVSQNNSLVLGGISGVNGGTDTNVGIGTTAPADRLDVDGIIRVSTLGAAGATSLCRNALNQISDCSSSLRYKTDIAPFGFGLNLVNRLQPIAFKWRDGGMRDLGLGAEDVAAIEPLLVNLNADGRVEGVKYDRIGVVLVNAVKEQQAQIESQRKEIDDLRGEVDALKKLICATNADAAMCKK